MPIDTRFDSENFNVLVTINYIIVCSMVIHNPYYAKILIESMIRHFNDG